MDLLRFPTGIFGFVKISHWLQLAPGSDRASCFFHRARGGDHRRGSKSRIKLAHKLNRQNQRLPNAFKIFKIFPTNTFDPRRASLEEELPLSNHQHRCRFCHFTSKKDFLIESPLSFSSKFPPLGGRSGSSWCLLACLTRLSGQITKLKVWTEISITSLSRPPSERAIVCSRAPVSG